MGTTWMDAAIAAEAAEENVEKLARLLCYASSVVWGDGSDDWGLLFETVKDGYRQQARWLLQRGVRLEVEE